MLTERFDKALSDAFFLHMEQKRKGGEIPYISHLLAVTALVLEDGGDEDEAIAALLHDAIEDQGVSEERIEERYGANVARLVIACTDTDQDPKPPWLPRKEAYIRHMEMNDDPSYLRVVAADKLHNAQCILRDVENGIDCWAFFNASRDQVMWYYRTIASILLTKLPDSRNAMALADVVVQLDKI